MSETYEAHLAALHARFEAPPAFLRHAGRALTTSPIESVRRLVAGEANEVYDIRFEDGLETILRIARGAQMGFEHERWAIDRCAERGLPVPRMHLTERFEWEGEVLAACFLEKLEGERLSDRLDLPRETLRTILQQAGAILSTLHTVPTRGAGDLDGEGRGPFATFEDLLADFLVREGEFADVAAKAGCDPDAVRRAFGVLATAGQEAAPIRTCLTHNDFRACHLLVKGGRVTGLIDFGQVSGESPVNEFAKWDFWEGEVLPVAWLMEGYADKRLFDAGFKRLFRMMRILNGLWALHWYAGQGFAEGVEQAKAQLASDLALVEG